MILKELISDFSVKELFDAPMLEKGPFCYCWMTKQNKTTEEAIQNISRNLGLQPKHIGYAGNKDKRAITKQLISLKGIKKQRIEGFKDLTFAGYGDKPISLGDNVGNTFVIVVRDLDSEAQPGILESIPNYFDEQRFSHNNADIGKAVVKKDFKLATKLILENEGKQEFGVRETLDEAPNNHIGAILTIPKRIRRMYVHAYQSLLFNGMLANKIKEFGVDTKQVFYSEGTFLFPEKNVDFGDLPLIGFGTKKEDAKEVLDQEKLTTHDFVIRALPDLSAEGAMRPSFVEVKNFSCVTTDDELHMGKKKSTLTFSLPKGAYATIVIKKVFC